MRHALVLGAFLALVGCVPSTDEPDPRGGIVITVLPAASTRGEPFTSTDGWTVHVDSFGARISPEITANDSFGVAAPPTVMGPRGACVLRVTAVRAGPALAGVQLERHFGVEGGGPEETAPACGDVDAEILARFSRPPDDARSQRPPDGAKVSDPRGSAIPLVSSSPTMVMTGHAEKAERRIRFDFALSVTQFGAETDGVPVEVVANQPVSCRVKLDVAALFLAPHPSPGARPILFDEIAAADANADGFVTGAELADTHVDCRLGSESENGTTDPAYCKSLTSFMTDYNGGQIFVPEGAP